MPFVDKPLKCKDCNDDFVFSAREQEHHAKLGLRNEPKRCPVCRQMQRMRNEDQGRRPRPPRAMRGPGGPGGPRFGPPPGGPREVFMAKCAACGKQTDLPFKPRGDRPVYCRDCFRSAKR
ncbi:MAG TPA: CxxC-x17-CxxC domain-containing protein [Planctomycetota bacterium]|nr:CxxC-x17-CxxC domain-containing protein [Planctomycetota bacterium]